MRQNYHDTELTVAHELHQLRDDASFHHNINTVIITVCEVGDCPACIRQDVLIAEMEKLDQRRKHLKEREHSLAPFWTEKKSLQNICGTECQTQYCREPR